MTVQAVVDLMEGHSRLVDWQPKNFYRQICCECVGRLTLELTVWGFVAVFLGLLPR